MTIIPKKPSRPRIAPLTPERWGGKAQEFIAMVEGPGGPRQGSKMNVIHTLAVHPDLAIPYFTFGRYIISGSTLPGRIRELATLRTAHLCGSDYEFEKHAVSAQKLGVSFDEIAAVRLDIGSFGWGQLEHSVLSAVDQLRESCEIDDEIWAGLAAHLSEEQLLDLIFTVGSYVMLAMVLGAVRVQPDGA